MSEPTPPSAVPDPSAPAPGDAPGGAASDAAEGEEHGEASGGATAKEKAAAAAGAAKNAAKAGLKAFAGFGARYGGNARGVAVGAFRAVFSLPMLLLSGDMTTRALIVGFAASVVLVCMTSVQLYDRFMPRVFRHSKSELGAGVSHFLEEEKKLAIAAANVLFLERFSGALDSKGETLSDGEGRAGVFELEIYVETDSPESTGVLRAHLAQTREIVSGVLQGHTYDELISDAGKEKLKKDVQGAVVRVLHRWTNKGAIKRVYFTRFIMG